MMLASTTLSANFFQSTIHKILLEQLVETMLCGLRNLMGNEEDESISRIDWNKGEAKIRNSNIYIDELNLVRSESSFKASVCFCYFSGETDYEDVIPYLHTHERNHLSTLKFQKRARNYLIGRFAAKQAIALLSDEENLANILIQSGIFTQPIITSNRENTQVSITHCAEFGAAIAFPEAHPMGIDLEIIDSKQRVALEGQVTKWEKQQIVSLPILYDVGLTLLWTAKEALSKVLKTGLMTPFDVFQISKIEIYDHYIMCYYKNFSQYKVICFTISNYMCSIVYPLKTELRFDPHALQLKFTFLDL
jgi:4'-phosphopantetheinyl transferase EntD